MRRPLLFTMALVLALIAPTLTTLAQATAFPLPASLYILTSDGMLLYIDPATGAQTEISNPNQPVADFDVAPDGAWVAFRTADEGMVIVSQIAGQSGYVLEFDSAPAPASGPAQTIAWSPDAAALAYIVPGGVRIAYPGAGLYGEPQIGLVQGDWHELYWESIDTLIVSDATGSTTRISGEFERWMIQPASEMPVRPQPVVASYLAAEGVMLGNQVAVPGTAGALAFDWGPLPPEDVTGYVMPASLYAIAPDRSGTDQVWRVPASGEPAQPITADVDPVTGYGVHPDGTRIAYVAGDALIVQDAGGASQQLALLELESSLAPSPQWSPDGTQIAFHDQRGVWIVPAGGAQPPRLIAQSVPFTEQTSPAETRFYFNPRWSPDGTRLLLGVGMWEGAILGVADLTTNALTELPTTITGDGAWTADGQHILAWSAYFAYSEPGLFLIDPALPDTPPTTLISVMPVSDVTHDAAGAWYALVSETAQMGPRFLRVWHTATLDNPFGPLFAETAGGFAEYPRLAADGAQVVIAGVQPQTQEQFTQGSGELRLIDMDTNTTLRLSALYPAHALQWGP